MAITNKGDVYYCKNPYFIGHEQGEHSNSSKNRPYLCIYSGDGYILGFAMTTEQKALKTYPSHRNIQIQTNNLKFGEIMLDQLQIICIEDIDSLFDKLDTKKYNEIIDNFLEQIVNDDILKYSDGINFGKIIKFQHNNPIMANLKNENYVVVSSNKFGKSGMSLIFPKINNGMLFLHTIDFKSRNIEIVGEFKYIPQDIENLKNKISSLLKI